MAVSWGCFDSFLLKPRACLCAEYDMAHFLGFADNFRFIGTPGTQSLQGITKKERQQQGKPGGVVRIAYITAVVPRVGQSTGEIVGENSELPIGLGEVRSQLQTYSFLSCREENQGKKRTPQIRSHLPNLLSQTNMHTHTHT